MQDNSVSNSPGMSSTLPIFSLLEGQLPETMKTPEAKKNIARIFFWAAFLGGGYMFYKALPTLIQFAQMSIWFIVYGVIAVSLFMLAPKIISFIHAWGNYVIFKNRKKLSEKYDVETLEMTLEDIKKTREAVRAKITEVEAVKISMNADALAQEKESKLKFEQMESLTAEAKRNDLESEANQNAGKLEKARQCHRDAEEARTAANLRNYERSAAEELKLYFAQSTNEIGKALEVIKDHESSVKIMQGLVSSSITILKSKLNATSKVAAATSGLVDVFGFKDQLQFQIAMQSVNSKICSNTANIRRNLEFLNESRLDNIQTKKSQGDLEQLVAQLKSGEMKKLGVREIASPYHELTSEEKVSGTSIFED